MTKLLIDKCLSAELALMARERGHHQASHVVWIGKAGWKDWELKQLLLDEDWVLVTWFCSALDKWTATTSGLGTSTKSNALCGRRRKLSPSRQHFPAYPLFQ